MKIAISSMGPTLDADVAQQVDQGEYWLIVQPKSMKYELLTNPFSVLGGPAQMTLIAQILHNDNVRTILTGSCSPEVLKAFSVNGVSIVVNVTGSVRNAVERFKESYRSSVPSEISGR